MKIFLLLTLIIICKNHSFFQEFIAHLKKSVTWQVQELEDNIFKKFKENDLRKLLGEHHSLEDQIKSNTREDIKIKGHPENFDARDKWKACIHSVRDQGTCGSCWAHSLVEVLSDLFCIFGKDIVLSPQDPISCDKSDNACDGGYTTNPWNYAMYEGIVTDTCFPYSSGKDEKVPPCPNACVNQGDKEEFVKYKCIEDSYVNYGNDVEKMKDILFNVGPFKMTIEVFEDFFHYKSGIYYHHSGDLIGKHAVKAIGYGTDKKLKMDFWIVQNSWGNSWGMNGIFNIKQGDCKSNVVAIQCIPDLSNALSK